nr:IS110 family transposase [Propioniciclava flava]
MNMPRIWAGIDAGKAHHHCVVVDAEGNRLYSKKVPNTETDILNLLAHVAGLADGHELTWATDLNQGGAALLIAVLTAHSQNVLYLPGRTVYTAARTYRGDAKTDAKDAWIIADQARMRRDLYPISISDEIATDLRLLCAHRTDLMTDRTRILNRLRATLLEYFPGLDAALDFAKSPAGLTLLTGYQDAASLRRMGVTRLSAWLRRRGYHRPERVAQAAVDAAHAQHTVLPGQSAAAVIVAKLATDVLRLTADAAEIEKRIEARLREHADAELLLSVPGFGPMLAAEFTAATGGSMTRFATADRLAGVAGLAPAPRDSGRISGNNHRPKRYDRRLLRACYLSAQVAAIWCPTSRAFYERKRGEGKSHTQAVLALARRRINVIWAMLRDRTTFQHPAAVAASTT